jgi:hypothetical protein
VRDKYGLEEADYPCYNRLVAAIPLQWNRWLTVDFDCTESGEYISVFTDEEAHFPHMVFLTTNQFRPSLTSRHDQFYLPVEIPSFEVEVTSMLLQQRISPSQAVRRRIGLEPSKSELESRPSLEEQTI